MLVKTKFPICSLLLEIKFKTFRVSQSFLPILSCETNISCLSANHSSTTVSVVKAQVYVENNNVDGLMIRKHGKHTIFIFSCKFYHGLLVNRPWFYFANLSIVVILNIFNFLKKQHCNHFLTNQLSQFRYLCSQLT